MRIFLDANILFSAANSSGSIRQLLTIARTAGHECWANEQVIREAHRNLFLKQRERIPDFEHLLGEIHFASKLPISAGGGAVAGKRFPGTCRRYRK